MKNFIELYENALSDDVCDYMVSLIEDNIGKAKQGVFGKGELDYSIKKSKDLNLATLIDDNPNIDNGVLQVKKALQKSLVSYFKKYQLYDYELEHSILELTDEEFFKIIICYDYLIPKNGIHTKKYDKNDGHYSWHKDQYPGCWEMFTRAYVMMFYLNDVKEGGETGFLAQGVELKPKKGSLVIFPARHIHKGKKPISEEKYICNFWLLEKCPPLIKELDDKWHYMPELFNMCNPIE